jgi:uncharacterized protein
MTLADEDRASLSKRPWRIENGRTVLFAYRRGASDALFFPPLPATSPRAAQTTLVPLTGTPTLYSFTVMHPSPKTGKPPMPLGFADFPEGVRIFGRLIYPQGRRPAIGDALRPCVMSTEDGDIHAFELCEDTQR